MFLPPPPPSLLPRPHSRHRLLRHGCHCCPKPRPNQHRLTPTRPWPRSLPNRGSNELLVRERFKVQLIKHLQPSLSPHSRVRNLSSATQEILDLPSGSCRNSKILLDRRRKAESRRREQEAREHTASLFSHKGCRKRSPKHRPKFIARTGAHSELSLTRFKATPHH